MPIKCLGLPINLKASTTYLQNPQRSPFSNSSQLENSSVKGTPPKKKTAQENHQRTKTSKKHFEEPSNKQKSGEHSFKHQEFLSQKLLFIIQTFFSSPKQPFQQPCCSSARVALSFFLFSSTFLPLAISKNSCRRELCFDGSDLAPHETLQKT